MQLKNSQQNLQNLTFINNVNIQLKKYGIKIIYYPRTQYIKNKWIINDIYLEL